MRILVVSESLDPNSSSGAKGRISFIKSLIEIYESVTIVYYSQEQVKIKGAKCIQVKESKINPLFLLSRVQRKLFTWFRVDIGNSIDKILGFSFGFFNDVKSIKGSLRKFNASDFDAIWTLSNGNSYRSHKAVLSLNEWHSKWYAYIHDPYPQQLYPRPYNYVPFGFKQKRLFFKQITIKSKRVVFPSALLKQWMESYYVYVKDKSLIIPHQSHKHNASNTALPEYFDVQYFNILHAGNLLDLRDPKPLVNAFLNFIKNNPRAQTKARLIFLGKKSIFSEGLNELSNKFSQIFVSEDYVMFNEVLNMQLNTAVNVILEANSEISPFLPGKFAHCVSADKPILAITPYYSEVKRLLGSDYPYIFEINDEEDMSTALNDLFNEWCSDSRKLKLNRPDLHFYLSSIYMKEQIIQDKTC